MSPKSISSDIYHTHFKKPVDEFLFELKSYIIKTNFTKTKKFNSLLNKHIALVMDECSSIKTLTLDRREAINNFYVPLTLADDDYGDQIQIKLNHKLFSARQKNTWVVFGTGRAPSA